MSAGMNMRHAFDPYIPTDTQKVDTKQRSEAQYPENEYGTQNMSTAAQLIRVQSEQIGRRPTFRDLLDRIMAGVNSGEFMMQDPVPEGFFEDGHIDVARYIADKYDIRGDADE